MTRFWRWFLPGLQVKRWLLLFLVGVFLMGFGLSLVWQGRHLYAELEAFLRFQVLRSAHQLSIAPWAAGLVVSTLGAAVAYLAAFRLGQALVETLQPVGGATRHFLERRQLFQGPRVVAIGGGTGLPTLLRGLKAFSANLVAIVTVADDGGSSGRLRSEFGILPPGDIRNCLIALADTEPVMEQLLQHRFREGSGLSGHSFGNLLILAMAESTGNFYDAIRRISQVLAVRGRVMPPTLTSMVLQAELADGRMISGESAIGQSAAPIRRVFLESEPEPLPEALAAIAEADVIVLGPGSLYTSVIPNLLVPGMAEAIRRSAAVKMYICNIMTQPGETDGYTVADHVRAIVEHAGFGLVDYCIVNTGVIPPPVLERYRLQGARPVALDITALHRLGVGVRQGDLLVSDGLVRHHPQTLARAVLQAGLPAINRRSRSPWGVLWLRQRLREREEA